MQQNISFMINGAYYDNDQGVEPDYVIRTYDHLYNREALTDYINSLHQRSKTAPVRLRRFSVLTAEAHNG